MINNDVLRSLRYMLNINEQQLVDIVTLGGADLDAATLEPTLKKEDDEG